MRGSLATLNLRAESAERRCLLTVFIVVGIVLRKSDVFNNLITKNVNKGLQFLWIKKIISGSDRSEFCSNNGFEETKG